MLTVSKISVLGVSQLLYFGQNLSTVAYRGIVYKKNRVNPTANLVRSLNPNKVRSLNPNKAAGSDGISGQMLLLCDKSVVLPLGIYLKLLHIPTCGN